jgi:hypothetical protein
MDGMDGLGSGTGCGYMKDMRFGVSCGSWFEWTIEYSDLFLFTLIVLTICLGVRFGIILRHKE